MDTQEQIDADIAGQKISLKSNSLNTIATVATLMLVTVIAYSLYTHGTDTKESSRELVSALRDMAQVQRESNCLNTLPQERREANASLCKQNSR